MKALLTPARVASLLAGAGVLGSSLAPVIAQTDWQTAAGGIAGAVGVLGVLESFLKGQRAHEARQARQAPMTLPPAAYFAGTTSPSPIPLAAPAPAGDFTPPPITATPTPIPASPTP